MKLKTQRGADRAAKADRRYRMIPALIKTVPVQPYELDALRRIAASPVTLLGISESEGLCRQLAARGWVSWTKQPWYEGAYFPAVIVTEAGRELLGKLAGVDTRKNSAKTVPRKGIAI